jgi:hypothetical protein
VINRTIFLLYVATLCVACSTPPPEQPRWYKGDVHARCLSPGGAAAHACMADWYARRGYDFVVTDTSCYAADVKGNCLVLPGSECVDENGVWTTAVNTVSRIWTAVALREEVRQGNTSPNVLAYIPQNEGDLVSHHLRNIRRANGFAVLSRHTLAHLAPETAAAIEELKFIEIFDGDTLTEAPWDSLLTRRKSVFATASDTSWTGRAWVVLQADSLTPTGVVSALAEGRFYASSGVMLSGITQTHTRFAVKIDTAATRRQLPAALQGSHVNDTSRYDIAFITAEGKTATHTTGLRGDYTSKPGDGYVRVRVTYSNPADSLLYHAWTQPRMLTF